MQQLNINPPKTDNTSVQPTTSGLLEPLISSHVPTNTNFKNIIRGDDKLESAANIPKRTELSGNPLQAKENSKLYSLLTGQYSLLDGQYSSQDEIATGKSYVGQSTYSTRSRPAEQLDLDSQHDTRIPQVSRQHQQLVLDAQRDTRIPHTRLQPQLSILDSPYASKIPQTRSKIGQLDLDSQRDTIIPHTSLQPHQIGLDLDHDTRIPHTTLLDSSGISTSENLSSDTDIVNWILQNENALSGLRTQLSAQSQYNEEMLSENIPKTNYEAGSNRIQWNEQSTSGISTCSSSSLGNQENISSPLLHSLLTPVTSTTGAVPRPTFYTASKFDFANQACSDIQELSNTQIQPLDHDSEIAEVKAVFRYPQRTSTETSVFTHFVPNYCESKMLNTPINEVRQRSRSTDNTGDCVHQVQRSHSIGGNTMVFDNRVPPSSSEISTQVCDNVFPTSSNLGNLENDNSGHGQGQYSGCVHHLPISAQRSQRSSSVSSSSVHGRSSSCTSNVVVQDHRVQRSSSLDDMSHSDAHDVQDKFPFLSFLLKNEGT